LNPILQDVSIALGLLVVLMIALESGYQAGRRSASVADGPAGGQVGAIQGAILGLLALLLGFSFAGAATRFMERQDLIVREANAIGTAYLRADLLDEPHRAELQAALRRYTHDRIEPSARLRYGIDEAELAKFELHHAQIWSAATTGIDARPASTLAVLNPVNDVIDLHSTRMAAGRKHLPMLVIGLLIACSLLAIGIIGYGCGLSGRRRAPLTVSLSILIGTALWTTIDLDHPRAGLMQLSDAPLGALRFEAPAG